MMQYLQWPLGRIGLNCQSSNQFLHYGRNSEMRADVREASLSYWLDLCQIVAAVRGFHVHLQICAAAGALENAFRVGATWNRQDCRSHTLIHSFRTHFTSRLLPHLFPSGACRSLSLSLAPCFPPASLNFDYLKIMCQTHAFAVMTARAFT